MSAITKRDPTARALGAASLACVALGGASILASIATWNGARGETAEETAHAERYGIFVGLWAPTFLILADYLRRSSEARTAGAPFAPLSALGGAAPHEGHDAPLGS